MAVKSNTKMLRSSVIVLAISALTLPMTVQAAPERGRSWGDGRTARSENSPAPQRQEAPQQQRQQTQQQTQSSNTPPPAAQPAQPPQARQADWPIGNRGGHAKGASEGERRGRDRNWQGANTQATPPLNTQARTGNGGQRTQQRSEANWRQRDGDNRREQARSWSDNVRKDSGEWSRNRDGWHQHNGWSNHGGNRDYWRSRNWSSHWDRSRQRNWSGWNNHWSWTWGSNYSSWNHNWRYNNRYDWFSYRSRYPSYFQVGSYYAPHRGYSYQRLSVGFFLDALFFGDDYWIADPAYYRLPDVYGPYRWVRYYDDAVLVDIYTGEVADVIHDFFW